MAGYNARAIANYFLDKADAEGRSLTHMHLQKILYNAQGYWLAATGEPLFHQKVEAWKNGPVIPSVYREFRDCGGDPILTRAGDFDSVTNSFLPYFVSLAPDEREFLDAIWDGHKNVSAVKLSAISHRAGSPWHQIANGKDLGVHKGLVIPTEMIRKYFEAFTKDW